MRQYVLLASQVLYNAWILEKRPIAWLFERSLLTITQQLKYHTTTLKVL